MEEWLRVRALYVNGNVTLKNMHENAWQQSRMQMRDSTLSEYRSD